MEWQDQGKGGRRPCLIAECTWRVRCFLAVAVTLVVMVVVVMSVLHDRAKAVLPKADFRKRE